MIEITTEVLTKILIFTLLLYFVFNMAMQITRKRPLSALIAIVTAILGSAFLTFEQITAVSQAYGVAAILILGLFPTLIAFFFIYNSKITAIMRKSFWIVYCLIIFLLIQNQNTVEESVRTIITLALIVFLSTILLLDTWIKNKINFKNAMKGR